MATDLFALGSTIYELLTGHSPYEEVPSDEVDRLYEEKNFPDISGLPVEMSSSTSIRFNKGPLRGRLTLTIPFILIIRAFCVMH